MKELLSKSKINYSKLRGLIHRVAAKELGNLAEPCYYPSMKKYYYEFLHTCGLNEKDMKDFVKRFYGNTKYKDFELYKNPITNLYIFIIHVFLENKDQIAVTSAITVMSIRYYSNRMHKLISYCNSDVFRYTLDNITKTHLFSREKTISNGLYFLSKEVQKKHMKSILDANIDGITKFIAELKHRINQSTRSFAQVYYKASKEGISIKRQPEEEEDQFKFATQEKELKVVNDIVKKITVYKNIDKVAMNNAKTLTKASSSVATLIVNNLSNIKYADNIRTIIQLFVKDLKKVSDICGKEYYNYVRSLMGIKRTTKKIYFKQQINVLLIKVLDDINYTKKYNSLTSQTQFLMNLYLAYYLTMVLRNTIC